MYRGAPGEGCVYRGAPGVLKSQNALCKECKEGHMGYFIHLGLYNIHKYCLIQFIK